MLTETSYHHTLKVLPSGNSRCLTLSTDLSEPSLVVTTVFRSRKDITLALSLPRRSPRSARREAGQKEAADQGLRRLGSGNLDPTLDERSRVERVIFVDLALGSLKLGRCPDDLEDVHNAFPRGLTVFGRVGV